MRSVRSALILAVIAAAPAAAQYRPHGGARPEDALAIPPRPAPGVAALVLDHAADFALADSQRVVLESIRRTQDSANRPWIARLDSLRPTSRPVNSNDLSPEQQQEIAARRSAIAAVMEGMRDNNAIARQRTMAVLSPPQQQRAAELENDARKHAEEERARSAQEVPDGSGQRRRGRGGMGRPPEG